MVKSLNKFVTNAAIAGTNSQGLLETLNPLVTTANYVGDKPLRSFIFFKGTQRVLRQERTSISKLVAVTHGKEKQ
jgi:hypothetical protein